MNDSGCRCVYYKKKFHIRKSTLIPFIAGSHAYTFSGQWGQTMMCVCKCSVNRELIAQRNAAQDV